MAKQLPLRWWSSPRALLRHILQLDDTPHSIALGTAVGMSIGLTPTVGIQMILVMLFAVLVSSFFRFNRIAALLTVYISNPLTMVPLYWGLYKVGTLFVGGSHSLQHFSEILEYDSFETWWETIVTLFVDIGEPLLVGTLIVATIGGTVTYPVMRMLLMSLQKRKPTGSEAKTDTVASKAD